MLILYQFSSFVATWIYLKYLRLKNGLLNLLLSLDPEWYLPLTRGLKR